MLDQRRRRWNNIKPTHTQRTRTSSNLPSKQDTLTNSILILGQSRRRWATIKPVLPSRRRGLVQWLKLPAWKIRDRG